MVKRHCHPGNSIVHHLPIVADGFKYCRRRHQSISTLSVFIKFNLTTGVVCLFDLRFGHFGCLVCLVTMTLVLFVVCSVSLRRRQCCLRPRGRRGAARAVRAEHGRRVASAVRRGGGGVRRHSMYNQVNHRRSAVSPDTNGRYNRRSLYQDGSGGQVNGRGRGGLSPKNGPHGNKFYLTSSGLLCQSKILLHRYYFQISLQSLCSW